MAIILTIANQKGGSGKTTTAVNLSDALTEIGKVVMLIDGDYQANATSALKIDGNHPGLATAIRRKALFQDFVISTLEKPLIDVLPGNIDLNNIGQAFDELERNIMLDPVLGIVRKGAIIKKTTALKGYDYVIIDTHPSLDSLLTAALAISDGLVIPLFAEKHSVEGLKLIHAWYKKAKMLNETLAIAGCLVGKFDSGNATHRAYLDQIRMIPEKYRIPVFNTVIPNSDSVPGASALGETLSKYQYSRNARITMMFRNLAKEIDALYNGIQTDLIEPPKTEQFDDIDIAIEID